MTGSRQQPIYLDYAASAPIDAAVAAAMTDVLGSPELQANPSSAHPAGRAVAARAEQARGTLADAVGAQPREIIWTSGATEADNLAVIGGARMQRERGRGDRVVTAGSEHQAVLAACEWLETAGFKVTRLPPARNGTLRAEDLDASLDDDVVLVSLMSINNETGVCHDIPALGERARRYGALMHVDAAQGLPEWPENLADWPVDLVSLSAHKCHGPAGVGALWRRHQPRARLHPLIVGGGQEGGLRAGTLPLHQLVGMAEAHRLAAENRRRDAAHIAALRQRLEAGLARVPALVRNGCADGAAHILNVSVAGVHGDALRDALGPEVTVSAGSACSSREGEPSHVLRAMGRPDALAGAALRISLGRDSTAEAVDEAARSIAAAIEALRSVSPAGRALAEGGSVGQLYAMATEPELLS